MPRSYIFIKISNSLMPIKGVIKPPNPNNKRFRVRDLLADTGRYRTPFNASGTNRTIISALKIIALRIAL